MSMPAGGTHGRVLLLQQPPLKCFASLCPGCLGLTVFLCWRTQSKFALGASGRHLELRRGQGKAACCTPYLAWCSGVLVDSHLRVQRVSSGTAAPSFFLFVFVYFYFERERGREKRHIECQPIKPLRPSHWLAPAGSSVPADMDRTIVHSAPLPAEAAFDLGAESHSISCRIRPVSRWVAAIGAVWTWGTMLKWERGQSRPKSRCDASKPRRHSRCEELLRCEPLQHRSIRSIKSSRIGMETGLSVSCTFGSRPSSGQQSSSQGSVTSPPLPARASPCQPAELSMASSRRGSWARSPASAGAPACPVLPRGPEKKKRE